MHDILRNELRIKTMSPQALAAIEDKLGTKGSVSLNKDKFEQFFDAKARQLVKLSGKDALRRIRSGKAGLDLAWTELKLLAPLLR
jgi:hypothetical protein